MPVTAVRGSIVDLFPAGEPHPIRLDSSATIELEALGAIKGRPSRLKPSHQCRLRGAARRDSVKASVPATAKSSAPRPPATCTRRFRGGDAWPAWSVALFEEGVSALFDHLGEHDVIVPDGGRRRAGGAQRAIQDYF
jgi:transcription-repair coupling factor (superfamily II helicase)